MLRCLVKRRALATTATPQRGGEQYVGLLASLMSVIMKQIGLLRRRHYEDGRPIEHVDRYANEGLV